MMAGRVILPALGTAFFGIAAVGAAPAEPYPSRPITMIVPFAVGGTGDTIARVIAPSMARSLGQNIVIENVGRSGWERR